VTANPVSGQDHLAYDPSWSRDGKQLLFTETLCHSCNATIQVMRLSDRAGWLDRRLGEGFRPRFSPDGRRVVYVTGDGEIRAMPAAGGRSVLVARGGFANDTPSWSPDGRLIAFSRQETAVRWNLFVVRPDGGGLRRVTNRARQAVTPAWSPDGRRLAFALQERTYRFQVYVVDADGRHLRRLSRGSASDSAPTWSPDGKQIAFVRQQGTSRSAVFVMRSDGSGARRLSPRGMDAVQPSWSPRGPLVAYAGIKHG
jgi:TolB protein